jgi:hypothetical protein
MGYPAAANNPTYPKIGDMWATGADAHLPLAQRQPLVGPKETFSPNQHRWSIIHRVVLPVWANLVSGGERECSL